MVAAQNSAKLEYRSATTPMNIPAAATVAAITKPGLRPIRRMSMVAGIADAATATTINDNGSVTNALFDVRDMLMMPPSVTSDIVAVAEISWQLTRTMRLRACITLADQHDERRILTQFAAIAPESAWTS
jgi:hypothetical protein